MIENWRKAQRQDSRERKAHTGKENTERKRERRYQGKRKR